MSLHYWFLGGINHVRSQFQYAFRGRTKRKSYSYFGDYGLTMPQAFKLFLNQIVKTKTIPLSFDYARETALTPKAAAKLLQSLKEIENGEYTEYETVEEATKAMSDEAHG